MASSKLLFFLISPFFFHFLAPGTIAQLEWQYGLCYPNGNYTINSTYESNLNHVLNSLTSDTSIDYGFYKSSYGENEDKAYAFGLCRPDMEPDTCRNCINEASNNITSICPKYLIAIAGFDDRGYNNCMLRYADYDIFGVMETQPYFFVHSEINITENLVEFNQTRNRLLERLISAAAARGSPHKYAVGEEPVKNILSLYALVQCNPYLSEDDCIRCLNDTTKLIPECCDKREGGRVITPSCNFRYATSKFYKASIEGPPVVSPTPPTRPSVVSPTLSTRPPVVSPTPPTNQKGTCTYELLLKLPVKPIVFRGKKNCTVIIVICSVVGSVLLIIFIGSNIFLRMRKREEEYEKYIMHGRISVKSNVYSFGTLVLEIMSGQKISSFGTEEESEGLLTYAWKNWNDGTASNLIDPSLRDGSTDEMMKCIHIGLLCVQENVSDRPTMASVVVMLSSEILTLSAPSKPGFFKQNSIIREASSSKEHHSGSRNEVSITELYPR
ncbi:hypothetical protein JRO89_XS06G0104700 [Xanthoceras sorbifolium]|uniref:Gnk2-homologous domain-containing protein n=1 Tax=Xanthoceras sorbifolium TaxID=99658 RepID=A0ABQ8HXL0_9ROSI|nr:hypothetical protein JRO89_XS06G0104700 [Xanthoceras sorbifolium]